MPHTIQAPSVDAMFDVLSDEYRRHILSELAARTSTPEPEVDVETLIPSDASSKGRVARQFHHVQLPKLADERLIEWERERGTVRRGFAFESVEPVISLFESNPEVLPGEW